MSYWHYSSSTNFPFYWEYKPKQPETAIPFKPGIAPPKNNYKNMWEDLKILDLGKIEVVDFPDNQFIHEEFTKKQIVIHHTISGNGVEGDISSWEGDSKRVATCMIIDRDGIPWQLFSSKYWAGHLGAGNLNLDKNSLGIELDNWGWLIPGDGTIKQFGRNPDGTPKFVHTVVGKFYAYYGNSVTCPMTYYDEGFRGYKYYETYTEKQLRTLGELILYWKLRYAIPVDYKSDMWDVSPRALAGAPGIWTHVSYRPMPEKSDCHPQQNFIEMLKTLDKIV